MSRLKLCLQYYCIPAFLLVILPPNVYGTNKPESPAQSTNRKSSAQSSTEYIGFRYIQEPFDAGIKRLPAGFKGHDLKAIYLALKKIGAQEPKSQYETTPQYERRITVIGGHQLFGSLNGTSTFAFVLYLSGETTMPSDAVQYDADTESLTIELPAERTTLYMEPSTPALITILLSRELVDSGNYVGANAFGVTVKVSSSTYEEYGIAIAPHRWPFNTAGDSEDDIRVAFRIHIAPDEAQRLANSLALVFVGTIEAPWVDEDVTGHDPTIDAPYETASSQHYVRFLPQQIWVVDEESGTILRRFMKQSTEEASNNLQRTDENTQQVKPKQFALSTLVAAKEPHAAQIFREKCLMCHGKEGTGFTAIRSPNFTNPKWQSSHTSREVLDAIRDGIPGTAMVSFKAVLSQEQISDLVKYVRSLGTQKGN